MDMLFFGDTGGTPEDYGGTYEAGVRYGAKWPRHDMAPMIPLMAKAASGVGFAITMSTTYHHPFYVARFFNALDHVTRGRIAWNAVTSAYKNEAANYGFDVMMDHDERYRRAQEFLEVACKLWDSVETDAIVTDRERGIFADPAKVHRIDHRGRYFNVRGPLPTREIYLFAQIPRKLSRQRNRKPVTGHDVAGLAKAKLVSAPVKAHLSRYDVAS